MPRVNTTTPLGDIATRPAPRGQGSPRHVRRTGRRDAADRPLPDGQRPSPLLDARTETPEAQRQLRRRFAGKLYVVSDNLSPHKKTEVTAWCERNDVELVFTRPTPPG